MPWYRGLVVVLLSLLVGLAATLAWAGAPATAGDVLVVSGSVTNAQGKGVKDAEPSFFVDGAPVTLATPPVTDSNGTFEARLDLPAATLPAARVEMSVARSAYKTSPRIAIDQIHQEQDDGAGNGITSPTWR